MFKGLTVQVESESWENTDSDGRDEHQECEIDINTVGRAERRGEGGMNGWRDR